MSNQEEIAICNYGYKGLVVEIGRISGARLQWSAPGLSIYTKGALPVTLYAQAANIACNEAIARHIPARSLVRVIKSGLNSDNDR